MDDNKGLELKIKTSASEAKTQINSLKQSIDNTVKSLTKAGYSVQNIRKVTNAATGYSKAIVTASNGTVTLKQNIDKLGRTTGLTTIERQANKAKSSLSKLFTFGNLYAFWNVTKGIRDGLADMVKNAINFIETTNKFEVSFGKYSDQAYKFINTVSERFGLAREDLMDYMSTYNNIMNSLSGITRETSEKISESLTKMAIDYASLFNTTTGEAMEKFQSALVGQTRPIRAEAGYDITEKTLGEKAKELGISTGTSNLNQVEKRLLRIIVLMEQLKNTKAMGDFARTIEQPANQLKILNQQLKELGQWLGGAFLQKIKGILPYVNGLVMALKEIARWVALISGYQLSNGAAASLEDATEGTADNLSDAVGSAKELKKTLMGFDVLNVIQTPTASAGGSGDVGGIDPKILSALGEYDNLLENVEMKATKIRDKILEWLGFTKDTNGELHFSAGTLLSNIFKWWQKLNGLGKIFVGIGVLKVVSGIWSVITKLVSSNGLKLVWEWIKKILGPAGDLLENLKLGLQTRTKTEGFLTGLKNGFGKWYKEMKPIPTMLKGITQAIGGIFIFSQGFKDFTENGNKILGTIEMIGGALLILAGTFTTVVAIFKAKSVEMSASLAAATAGISVLVTAVVAIGTAVYNLVTTKSELEEYTEAMSEMSKTARDNATASAVEYSVLANLTDELGKYVDAKGQINEKDKERVEFILTKLNGALGTEYKLVGNQITQNGKAVKSYDKVKDSINRVILKLKAKAILEAKHDQYIKALQNNVEVNEKIEKSQKRINEVYASYQEKVNQGIMTRRQAQEEADKDTEKEKKNLQELLDQRAINSTAIREYSKLEYDIESENYKNLQDKVDKYFGNIDEHINGTSTELKTKITNAVASANTEIDDFVTNISTKKPTLGFSLKLPSVKDIQSKYDNKSISVNAKIKIGNSVLVPKNTYSIHKQLWADFVENGIRLSTYAKGGFPDVGQMFVAREAGPELVGNIGGQSAVVNNDQIVEAVSQGVARAVASVMPNNGGSYNLYIDGQQITDIVTQRIDRMANITGGVVAYG